MIALKLWIAYDEHADFSVIKLFHGNVLDLSKLQQDNAFWKRIKRPESLISSVPVQVMAVLRTDLITELESVLLQSYNKNIFNLQIVKQQNEERERI